jgi:hypothetical protein
MHHDGRGGWAGELRVVREDQEAALFHQSPIGDQLFALPYGVRVAAPNRKMI